MKNTIIHSEPGRNLLGNNTSNLVITEAGLDFEIELKSIGKSYVLSCEVLSSGALECCLCWLNNNEALRNDLFAFDADELKVFRLFYSPLTANKVLISLILRQGQSAVIKDLKFSHELVSGFGEIMQVSGIEDINEPMDPQDYWSLFPELKLPYMGRKISLNPLLRQYFDIGFIYELDFGLDIAEETDKFMKIPVRNGMLGMQASAEEPYIIAGDIKYNPIMKSHFTYSNRYYPRRHQDYLGRYFFPAYILTGDDKYLKRAEELLEFFKYSRWEKDGSNKFVQEHYPKDYKPHPEWYGGFDYLFDWEWLDGYGYLWKLHEPDHHVNSAIASTFVTAFQLTGRQEYYETAFQFVFNQMPRYGFHKGIYKDQVYYYTEYNPTGASLGNPVTDATDNVVSLAASACATVGYYISEPRLRGQFLELARGLLWYLVREYNYDKWFYYDGAENPLNPRRYVSHDMAAMRFAFSALAYLYKAGADIDLLLNEFEEIDKNITKNSKDFDKIGHFRLYKMYEGELYKGNQIEFVTFVKVKTEGVKKAVFYDDLPEGFEGNDLLNVNISEIIPPDKSRVNFTTGRSLTIKVSPEKLSSGIEIPFRPGRGDLLKISYKAVCSKNFSDCEKNTESRIKAVVSGATAEYQCEASTGSAAIGRNITYSMQLGTRSKIKPSEFLTLAAAANYPFPDEIEACLID